MDDEVNDLTPRAEVGVVIERHINSELRYFNGRFLDDRGFVPKHEEAIRFAREEDAVVILAWLLGGRGRVAEHIWRDTTLLPTASPAPADSDIAAGRVETFDSMNDLVRNLNKPATCDLPTDYAGVELKVGLVVEATNGWSLRCGSGMYPHAIVVSVKPLVLASEQGDMLWTATVDPKKLLVVSKPSVWRYAAFGRYACELKLPQGNWSCDGEEVERLRGELATEVKRRMSAEDAKRRAEAKCVNEYARGVNEMRAERDSLQQQLSDAIRERDEANAKLEAAEKERDRDGMAVPSEQGEGKRLEEEARPHWLNEHIYTSREMGVVIANQVAVVASHVCGRVTDKRIPCIKREATK